MASNLVLWCKITFVLITYLSSNIFILILLSGIVEHKHLPHSGNVVFASRQEMFLLVSVSLQILFVPSMHFLDWFWIPGPQVVKFPIALQVPMLVQFPNSFKQSWSLHEIIRFVSDSVHFSNVPFEQDLTWCCCPEPQPLFWSKASQLPLFVQTPNSFSIYDIIR